MRWILAALLSAVMALSARHVPAAGEVIENPFPLTGAFQANHREDVGNVAIINFVGDYAVRLPGGEANPEPRAVVAREFFQTHTDDYDFLVIFSTFEFNTGEATALHWGVRNDVEGIGLPLFDNSDLFGSDSRLLGVIDMAATDRYELDPLRPGYETVLSVLGHETMHQWGSYVEFVDGGGQLSSALLGKDDAHWSDLLDTNASVLYGHDWRDNGDGSFSSIATRKFFSPLDLYLSGVVGPQDVPPMLLINNPALDPKILPVPNINVTGSPLTVTIEDIVAASGERVPAAEDSPKEWRYGFVLLAAPGEAVATRVIAQLETLRSRYAERVSAWTGGRMRAHVAIRALPDRVPQTPDEVTGDALRTTPASVEDALTWLRAAQSAAGNWEDKPSTQLRDTTVVYEALSLLDVMFSGGPLARSWLQAQTPPSSDYMARRAGALATGVDGELASNINSLLARANLDGGYGLAMGFASNNLDTALVLCALDSVNLPAVTGIAPAKAAASAYLLANQNADGGWTASPDGASGVYATSQVLAVLTQLGQASAAQPAALVWLAARQNADGGFGVAGSSIHDTSYALQAFVDGQALPDIRATDAAAYLLDRQSESGGFEGSTFKTALAALALQRFNFPNYRIDDVSSAPSAPTDGDQVRVEVIVSNDANALAPPSVVRLFDGDPSAGGVQIGDDIAIPALASGTSIMVLSYWDTFGLAGSRALVAEVDSDDLQLEMSERDNRFAVEVTVASPPAGIELSVVSGTAMVVPANPSRLPEPLGLSATVRNSGDTDANGIVVRLYRGPADDGDVLAENTLNLASRSSLPANFTHTLITPGTSEFTIVVDPDDAFVESVETNNQSVVTVETLASADLEVLDADISLTPALVNLGEDVQFTVLVRNGGTTAVASTPLHLSVSDGITTTLLSTQSVAVPPGETVTRTASWRANLDAAITFTAELDPANALPELDEGNNLATLQFTPQQVAGPNLVASFDGFTTAPNPALEGLPLNLTAEVRNTGNVDVSGVEVAFYLGDPGAGGTPIGATQTVASLLSGGSSTVGTVWAQVPSATDQLLFVVVDPNNQIAEFAEDDNATFNVVSVVSFPDLAVSAADLSADPQYPVANSSAALNVRIANLGSQDANVVVIRAYDGDPQMGGTPLGADQMISVNGMDTATASFALSFGAGEGIRQFFVQIDPENTIAEGSELNNAAALSVSVQNSDLFVSEQFISPNGDGRQDATELYFQLPGAQVAVVEVADDNGEVVRTIADFANAGQATWDGLDDFGRVVLDGVYSLTVRDITRVPLGFVNVTVDNNRSSLAEAIGTPFGLQRNLTCEVRGVEFFQMDDNETSIIFSHLANGLGPNDRSVGPDAIYGTGDGSPSIYPPGILAMDATGANVRAVVSLAAEGGSARIIRSMSATNDGARVAYVRRAIGGTATDKHLYVVDADGGNGIQIDLTSAAIAFTDANSRPGRIFGFSSESGEVLVEIINQTQALGFTHIAAVPTNGGPVRSLVSFDLQFGPSTPFSNNLLFVAVSPDGSYLAAVESQSKLYVYEAPVEPPSTMHIIEVSTGFTTSHSLNGFVSEFDLSWSPDGTLLALRQSEFDANTFAVDDFSLQLYAAAGNVFQDLALPRPILSDSYQNADTSVHQCLADGSSYFSVTGNLLKWSPNGLTVYADLVIADDYCRDEYSDGIGAFAGSALYAIDSSTAELSAIANFDGHEFVGPGFAFDPQGTVAFYPSDTNIQPQFQSVDERKLASLSLLPGSVEEPVLQPEQGNIIGYVAASPTGEQLLYHHTVDSNDSETACYANGVTDFWSFRSLLNLTVELRALRSVSSGGVILQGTASDLHFSTYSLDYANVETPQAYRPIAPASRAPVLDERLGFWVPPGPGSYIVRMTATDKAGNQRFAFAQVSWGATPDIADLFLKQEVISPNGDNVLESATLAFQVRQPVQLQFAVENDRGDVVRTDVQQYSTVGIAGEFVWDGRDDAGQTVSDGNYTIRVQSYRFDLIVDATAPAVVVSIDGIYSKRTVASNSPSPTGFDVVEVEAPFTASAQDTNLISARIERAAAAAPSEFVFYEDLGLPVNVAEDRKGLGFSRTSEPLESVTASVFRIVAEDFAGNTASAVAGPIAEQFVIYGFGPADPLIPGGSGSGLDEPLIPGDPGFERQDPLAPGYPRQPQIEFKPFDDEEGPLITVSGAQTRLATAESIISAITQVSMNHRRIGDDDGSDSPIVAVGDSGQYQWTVPAFLANETYVVRLRAVDADGTEHFSNRLSLRVDTSVVFRGRVEDAVAGDGGRNLPTGTERSILWGENNLLEQVGNAELYLTSATDPRFAAERRVQTVDVNILSFVFEADISACNTYSGRMIVTTASGVQRESIEPFDVPCIELRTKVTPVLGDMCNAPTVGRAVVQFAPISLDSGITLSLLTFGIRRTDGTLDVFFNENAPQPVPPAPNGAQQTYSHSYTVETAALAEGTVRFEAELLTSGGDQVSVPVNVIVDRTPPTLNIRYPAQGEWACAVPLGNGSMGVTILGVPSDANLLREATTLKLLEPADLGAGSFSSQAFTVNGPSGERLGTITDYSGGATVRLHGYDAGGALACVDQSFVVDGVVQVAGLAGVIRRFSPDGNGVLDDIALNYTALEPVTLTVELFAAAPSDGGRPQRTGSALGILESSLSLLPGAAATVWDGTLPGAGVLPDGHYILAFTFVDGCGLELVRDVVAEIDTTPPTVEITYPLTNDPLRLMVEVAGSVTDPNLDEYTVQFGVGAAPTTFALLDVGNQPKVDARLALWNTFGLEGDHVLRVVAVDRLGNERVLDVPIDIAARIDLINDLIAVPALISPNNDAQNDAAGIRIGLREAVDLSVRIETAQGAVVRTLRNLEPTSAGAVVVNFDGRDDGGLLVPDGEYTVAVDAALTVNPAVNQQENVTIEVDNTPPTVGLVRPDAYVSGTGSIIGTVNDVNLTEYVVSIGIGTAATDGDELTTDFTSIVDGGLGSLEGLEEGSYVLFIDALDDADNSTQFASAFIVDNTPPSVTISAPEADSVVGGINAIVAVSSTVEEANLATWTLSYGAGPSPQTLTELAAGFDLPITADSWDVALLADGAYTLELVATDLAGQTTTQRIAVQVDNTAPVVAITAPVGGGFITGPTTIIGTADDANLAEYRLEIEPVDGGLRSLIATSTPGVVGGTLHNLQVVPVDGAYRLFVVAEDNAGTTDEAAVEITIDTLAPQPPTVLVATVENVTDIRLNWLASASADVVAYNVFRGDTLITSSPIPDVTLLDSNAEQGRNTYAVVALDAAGLASESSVPAAAAIDTEPPAVSLAQPIDGGIVSGVVDIIGTAASADDFKHYRVYVAPAATPTARQLLRTSPLPTEGAELAQWDTFALLEGASFVLTLEAEDINGNAASASITISIDNTPPATPTGLDAVATGGDVAASWNTNSEADLLGYLLFRNDQLANVESVAIGVLGQYALTGTAYADDAVMDGTHAYAIAAIDVAGNLSDLSVPVTVTIDTRAPRASVVSPEDGQAFDGPLFVLAAAVDEDIASVQFEYKRWVDPAWIALGAPDTTEPFTVTLDPQALALSYDDYQLRAVATDEGGASDAAPPPIGVTYQDLTRPDAPSPLSALVDGDVVTLTWAASAASDLAGYLVDREDANGDVQRLSGAVISTTSFIDTAVADGEYTYRVVAVDTSDNESDPSDAAQALIYAPQLTEPYTPTRQLTLSLAGTSLAIGSAELERVNGAGTATVPAVATSAQGDFSFSNVALTFGINTLMVRIRDGAGNLSRSAATEIAVGATPLAPTGLTVDANGLDVTLAWDANGESDIAGYRVLRNGQPTPLPADVPNTSLLIDTEANAAVLSWPILELVEAVAPQMFGNIINYDVQAWTGSRWVSVAAVRDGASEVQLAQGYFTTSVRVVLLDSGANPFAISAISAYATELQSTPAFLDSDLTDGTYQYAVSAVSTLGFESALSAETGVDVGDVTAPDAVTLSGSVTGNDASLGWGASSSTDVARYNLYRNGVQIHQTPDAQTFAFNDLTLANDSYAYVVRVVDDANNASTDSNTLILNVAVPTPTAASNLTATADAEGDFVDLAWQLATGGAPADTQRVLRGVNTGGPYEEVAQLDSAATSFRDSGVSNGVTYFYVIAGADSIGNLGVPSNEVSATPDDTIGPAQPVITSPTTTGTPISQQEDVVAVSGTAEGATRVEVLINGESADVVGVSAGEPIDGPPPGPYTGAHTFVALSPDASKLVYYDNSDIPDIRVYDYTTQTVTSVELSDFDVPASWLPDSSAFLYVDSDFLTFQSIIKTFDLASGTAISLGPIAPVVPGSFFYELAVAPDGRQAVAVLFGQFTGMSEWWLLDLDGGAPQQFATAGGFPNTATLAYAWSPDSKYLAYLVGEDVMLFASEALTVTLIATEASEGRRPSWSPDSAMVGFATYNSTTGDYDARGYDVATQATETLFANADVPTFVDDANTVIFIRGEQILLSRNLVTREETELFRTQNSINAETLEIQAGFGGFQGDDAAYQLIRLSAGFRAPHLPLRPGDNIINAISYDDANNASPVSDPIVVTYTTGHLPDLSVSANTITVLPNAPIAGQSAKIGVTVSNVGGGSTPVSNVTLVVIGPNQQADVLIDSASVASLAPGETATFAAPWRVGDEAGTYNLVASVDINDDVVESSEANNFAFSERRIATQALPVIDVSIDAANYLPADDVAIEVAIANAGPNFTGRATVRVVDAQSFEVAVVDAVDVVDLGYGQSLVLASVWNTGSTFGGAYVVAAELTDTQGTVITSASAGFTLGEAASFSATIATDRGVYSANESALFTAAISFDSGNRIVEGAVVTLRVLDQNQAVVDTRDFLLGAMTPGSAHALTHVFNTGTLAPGTYLVDFVLNEGPVALAATDVAVEIAQSAITLAGGISLSEPAPRAGTPQQVTYVVRNDGNAALANLPVHVSLIDPGTGAVQSEQTLLANLAVGANSGGTLALSTAGLSSQAWTVRLDVDIDTGNGVERTLIATAQFDIVDRTPPQVEIRTPTSGDVINGDASFQIFASDDENNVDRVEYQLDNGPWTAAPLQITAQSVFGGTFAALSDGSHTLEARAFDTEQNEGVATSVQFTVASGAPQITITGVSNGEFRTGDVTPLITVTDLNLTTASIALNGITFVSGTTVTGDGAYTLSAYGENATGNTSSVTITFTIDATAPVIEVQGVVDGAATNADVTPVVVVTEINPASITITLNDQPFASGSTLSDEGNYTLVVMVTDQAGNTVESQVTFTIDTTPPVIVVDGVTPGELFDATPAYVYDVDATDPDGDAIFFELTVAPAGMFINSGNGEIRFKPAAAGDYPVIVRAVDPFGLDDVQSFTLSVLPPNELPTVTSDPVTFASVNQSYQYDIIATDPEGGVLTYEWVTGPAGMALDTNTGVLTWVPGAAGVVSVEVRVRDERDAVATQVFDIDVVPDLIGGSQ
jgi:subtilase family serine protease